MIFAAGFDRSVIIIVDLLGEEEKLGRKLRKELVDERSGGGVDDRNGGRRGKEVRKGCKKTGLCLSLLVLEDLIALHRAKKVLNGRCGIGRGHRGPGKETC